MSPDKQKVADQAEADFLILESEFASAGFRLTQHSPIHYRVRHPDWSLDLYPTNGRVYGKGPFLDLDHGWTLHDVLRVLKHPPEYPEPDEEDNDEACPF